MPKKLYIANDIECSGSMLGVHSVLSWGACVVTRDHITLGERQARGLTFYAELKPQWEKAYEVDAMRVGCVGLRCLERERHLPRLDVTSPEFDSELALAILESCGESVKACLARYIAWADAHAKANDAEVVPVVDTVFFDPGFIKLLFGSERVPFPYGWSGIDIDSFYRGYRRDMTARLRDMHIPDRRGVAHCALDDAQYIADQAQELIYNRAAERE